MEVLRRITCLFYDKATKIMSNEHYAMELERDILSDICTSGKDRELASHTSLWKPSSCNFSKSFLARWLTSATDIPFPSEVQE